MLVKPKKFLGQHFLADANIAKKISNSLKPIPDGCFVLEVGPGTGALTKWLQPEYNEKLLLAEIDKESIVFLKETYNFPDEQFVGDFLKTDLQSLGTVCVIGNFPYNISSQILFHILDNAQHVPVMCGMFQKEVAERLNAPIRTKSYGILSVMTQALYETDYLFTVHENVFIPPPKVKSGVIRLVRRPEPLGCSYKKLSLVVRTAFNQRRKMLSNSLKSIINDAQIPERFLNKRPEELTIPEFVEIAALLD